MKQLGFLILLAVCLILLLVLFANPNAIGDGALWPWSEPLPARDPALFRADLGPIVLVCGVVFIIMVAIRR